MLLAAGLGTRLRPITSHTPKALVEIDGVPILEIIARRLIAAGADRLIINTHHLGEQIEEFVADRNGFGVEVAFSREPDKPLETGGGVLNAAPLIRRDQPFFLHNTDVLSDLPLEEIHQEHASSSALATLAVMERATSRYLLFDDVGLLGRTDEREDLEIRVRAPVGDVQKLAFAGVHVISPVFLDDIIEDGAFSILNPYLRLAAQGAAIRPFRIDGFRWMDVGKPEQLEAAQGWRA